MREKGENKLLSDNYPYLDALKTSRFLYTSTITIVISARSVPNEDIAIKVMVTGEEYPGFKMTLSGTPVGTCAYPKIRQEEMKRSFR